MNGGGGYGSRFMSSDDLDAQNYTMGQYRDRFMTERANQLNASHNLLKSRDADYFLNEAKYRAEACLDSSYVNRPMMRTSQGTFMFFEQGEAVSKIDTSGKVDRSSELAKDARKRLDEMAGLIGGYPLSSLYNPSMQKGPDGAFTTKNASAGSKASAASSFGLSVSQSAKSPTKDHTIKYQNEKKLFYSDVVKI
jgi:hypothetical protein